MPKLPIPVPPPEEIDGAGDQQVVFVIPAQRRPGAPAPGALRGIGTTWLGRDGAPSARAGRRLNPDSPGGAQAAPAAASRMARRPSR